MFWIWKWLFLRTILSLHPSFLNLRKFFLDRNLILTEISFLCCLYTCFHARSILDVSADTFIFVNFWIFFVKFCELFILLMSNYNCTSSYFVKRFYCLFGYLVVCLSLCLFFWFVYFHLQWPQPSLVEILPVTKGALFGKATAKSVRTYNTIVQRVVANVKVRYVHLSI